MWGEFLPFLLQSLEESGDISKGFGTRLLIGFGENEAEGNSILTKEMNEIEVYLLGSESTIDEYKEAQKLLTANDIVVNHLHQFVLFLLTSLCISITRKVNKVPTVIDLEIVDEHGFTRHTTGFRQTFVLGEHVDEAALPHIRPSYEGIFRFSCWWTLIYRWAAGDVDGFHRERTPSYPP